MSELTKSEMLVLAGDLEHGPDCVWSGPMMCCYRDDDGKLWTDEDLTVPYVEPECTCGYFALLRTAQAKVRAMAEAA